MTGPFKDHKAAFDIIVEDLKHKNTENERLTRERDEARAELAEAKIELEELDFLRYEGGEESIGREIEKAEARGYERGVKEAAKVAEPYEFTAKKILALLEPTLRKPEA
jgi:hypothetical protein